MKRILNFATALAFVFMFVSCDDNENEETGPRIGVLELTVEGLEELSADFVYEGWIIVNGNPTSTGTFSDVEFPKSFEIDQTTLQTATSFVLSIEPAQDSDPAPSDDKILAGDFEGSIARLSETDMNSSTNRFGSASR